MAHWLDRRYPGYADTARKATYARDHYEASIRDRVEKSIDLEESTSLSGTKITYTEGSSVALQRAGKRGNEDAYLVQKTQGEHVESFRERARLSRYPRHMGRVVGSFMGQIAGQEARTVRTYDGENDMPDGHALASYIENIDGSGMTWRQATTNDAAGLMTVHHVWSLVVPPVKDGGRARVMFYAPEDVVNYYPTDGRSIEWVVFRERMDSRADPKAEQDPDAMEYYRLVTVDGMERWRKDGTNYVPVDEQMFSQAFVTADGAARLPVTHGYLQLGHKGTAHVGYTVAQDANYLYNLLSDIRHAIRSVTHNKLAGDVDDAQFRNTAEGMREGWNMLQGAWNYIGPDPGYTTAAYEIYKQEVRDFFVTSFQEYEDRARERTATEIAENAASGRVSFLSLLAETLDQIEQDRFFLIAQVERPREAATWEAFATVERSRDFAPLDAAKEAERLTDELFPEGIVLPAQETGEAIKKVLAALGMELGEEAQEAAGRLNATLALMRLNPEMSASQALGAVESREQLMRTDFTNGVEQ